MNPKVDQYLIDGCGRCEYYKTPQCKVLTWPEELRALRRIALETGLEEDYKWSQPCYTYKGTNVLMVSALKNCAVMAFFKGALLKDEHKLLIAPGKSSQADRQFRYTDVQTIIDQEEIIKAYIFEAIEVEKAGLKIEFKKSPEDMPAELIQMMDTNPELKQAFYALTPGRQRGYILHFSQPKQAKTRFARIEKWTPKILNGEGMHDKYKSRKK